MSLVIADFEYTTWPGALESGWAVPWQHREIVQIGAIRVDDEFNELQAFQLLVRPRVNPILSDLFVDLTHIEQHHVDIKGVYFDEAYRRFYDQFLGGRSIICMSGDEAVWKENRKLNGFTFEPRACTWYRLRPLLEHVGVDLTRVSSGDLHMLTDEPLQGHAHNALHDVRSMAAWLRYARRQGWPTSLELMPSGPPAVDPRSLR